MNPIILDVGAAGGKMTQQWYDKLKKGKFYCFEPLPSNFEILSTKFKDKNNVYLYNVAINDTEGMQTFYICPYANSSSLLPFVKENAKRWKHPKGTEKIDFSKTEEINVQSVRLDTFLRNNNLNDSTIDFIKIDTQGNDLKVVKSLGDKIYNVREIMLEVQIVPFEHYKGQSKKTDILDYMSSKGFKEYKKNKQSFGQEENIWFINTKFSYYLHLGF